MVLDTFHHLQKTLQGHGEELRRLTLRNDGNWQIRLRSCFGQAYFSTRRRRNTAFFESLSPYCCTDPALFGWWMRAIKTVWRSNLRKRKRGCLKVMSEDIIVGLDIGTTKILALVAEMKPEQPLQIIGWGRILPGV